MITSAGLYPIARRLHALIPSQLRRWTIRSSATGWRTICRWYSPRFPVSPSPGTTTKGVTQAVMISQALAGFVTMWGCRYGNCDDDVHCTREMGAGVYPSSRITLPVPPMRCRSRHAGTDERLSSVSRVVMRGPMGVFWH
jgi:hypothetical protein